MAIKPIPYSRKALFAVHPPRARQGKELNEIAFPLGGIGSGSIALSGRGALIDWEIFNRPGKGYRPEQTFFSLWARKGRQAPVFRVLEERQPPPYHGPRENPYASGPEYRNAAGLPRVERVTFTGSYPVARVAYHDAALPLRVSLTAFSPFIPVNDKDSSLPVAIFTFRLKNPGKEKVQATLAMNLQNRCGHPGCDKTRNEYVDFGSHRGLAMSQAGYPEDHPRYGTMVLATPWKRVTWTCQWPRVGGMGGLQHFCNTFVREGRFDDDAPLEPAARWSDIGSLGLCVNLGPNEQADMTFFIAWHFPWHEKYWDFSDSCGCTDGPCGPPKWKNYYATVWPDARAVAAYTAVNLPRLQQETMTFSDDLHTSTLPAVALDAVSSQMSILKTTTCIRLEDGTFYGWEGCTPNSGCCQGTCTHVWNYAQALPWLFPALERTIRNAHFAYDQRESDGHMQFRLPLPLGTRSDNTFHAAADGQLGDVLKVYREYLICGDLGWLRGLWPKVKKALEYAWVEWDADKDGLLEGLHHNTYDIEFRSAEPLAQTFYLAALRAGEALAHAVGDEPAAREYHRLFKSGRKKTEQRLWRRFYYCQEVSPGMDMRWQYGTGCLADQLIGQWYARMLGLGDLLNPARIRKALGAIFRYNWQPDLTHHVNPQRVYALNDDAGLLLCTWPSGGRPAFPFFYSDEVWTGIEYQVASHMIYEGLIEEGLAIVMGVRRRHDGERRNPWNEFECGNHYARAMASWSLLLALAGFSYSAPERRIGFSPRVTPDDFRCFLSVDSGWGVFWRRKTPKGTWAAIEVHYGRLELACVELGGLPLKKKAAVAADLDGRKVDVALQRSGDLVRVVSSRTITIPAGSRLRLRLV